ncbi:MAG: hypothetical protein DRQ89_14385 [Epsilonproteobacteria bacterium]|nr:MAG: hypothetical protein DRQ89_14385 [Campylobacterota bacterium]
MNSEQSNQPDQAYVIKEKLAQLEATLLSQNPGMKSLLQEIHKALKADPDVVTLLTETECSILVRGLKKQTATEIATKSLGASRKKAMNKMTVADL